MRQIHFVLGTLVVAALAVLWLWALGTWILRRREVHRWFWSLLAGLQVALVLQALVGVVLLALGARRGFLHYAYGAFFPALVLVGAHVVGREMRESLAPWKVFGIAALFAFGLTLRALTTGIGIL